MPQLYQSEPMACYRHILQDIHNTVGTTDQLPEVGFLVDSSDSDVILLSAINAPTWTLSSVLLATFHSLPVPFTRCDFLRVVHHKKC